MLMGLPSLDRGWPALLCCLLVILSNVAGLDVKLTAGEGGKANIDITCGGSTIKAIEYQPQRIDVGELVGKVPLSCRVACNNCYQ